jgi:acyl-CoA reductase-like NAD-dependent aldehyde dehydrogenase
MKAPPFRAVTARMLIGGQWRAGERSIEIRDPYRGEVVGTAPLSSGADVEAAVAAAVSARDVMAAMPGYERAALLRRAVGLIEAQVTSLAELLTRETGKAIKDSESEIRRSIETIALAAEEAIRIEGRQVPLEGSAMGAGKIAWLLRFPVGVVAAITPFNAPFNLAAHKIAPAVAAGNSLVLKPPPQAPLIVYRLVELMAEAGLPAGALNVVYGGADVGAKLVADPRVDFITFTGSSRAGAAIKAASGLRRVALELGGNNVTIVHDDADVVPAAAACARNAVRLSGQSCISVQSVYVHHHIYEHVTGLIADQVRKMKLGDPLDPATDVGTLIDEAAARRVESWVEEASSQGARVVVGGHRHRAAYEPTVLTGVNSGMKVVCEEIFGPVLNVLSYESLDEPIAAVNAGAYALHTGIFTKSNEVTFRAIRTLRVGGVIINGTSTWRTDQLAYGGIRASGAGREGPRYAIEEMTDQRLVVFNL